MKKIKTFNDPTLLGLEGQVNNWLSNNNTLTVISVDYFIGRENSAQPNNTHFYIVFYLEATIS